MATENKTVTGTNVNWAKLAVRDEHGALDITATLLLVEKELSDTAGAEVSTDTIAEHTAGVFDKLTKSGSIKNASMELSILAQRVVAQLDAPYGTETRLNERVKDYVRGESDRFEATNGSEGLYLIQRGKGGGVRLSTESFVKEYREKQAKKAAKAA